jgi:hypothetical protein
MPASPSANIKSSLPYPGRNLKMGDPDIKTVKALQARLNALGCGPLEVDGDFGTNTKNSVSLFQTRSSAKNGVPLLADGVVGAITWEALFGERSVPQKKRSEDQLLRKALGVAVTQLHVREEPMGSNRGPEVDEYLRSAGKTPEGNHFPWCASFVYWCFNQAAKTGENPVIQTAGVLDHWNKAGRAGIKRVFAKDAIQDPGLVQPGFIFIIKTGGVTGHTGLVEQVNGGSLTTLEGNTNGAGSREGQGVFRLTTRKIADINVGYIDYGKADRSRV